MNRMKLSTVANGNEGQLAYGSPKYPMWVSDEPDIYVELQGTTAVARMILYIIFAAKVIAYKM